MSLLDLGREGNVFVLTMRSGENRFNRPFLDALNQAFDTVERSTGPAALVTTGEEKFFSNGLDLAWLSGDGHLKRGMYADTLSILAAGRGQ